MIPGRRWEHARVTSDDGWQHAAYQHPQQPSCPPRQPQYGQPFYPATVAVIAPQQRSQGAAVALELVPGLFGVFGIGSLYAGKITQGVLLMVSFWVFFWINAALILVFVGWITLPLTWIGFLVLGVVSASRAVEEHNRRMWGG
jgi:TM2 domain-containing membrane protein YozV